MGNRKLLGKLWCGCAMIVLLATSGCSQLRLPRIDPSGERIFLPPPNYTTVVAPEEALAIIPEPAYPAPPSIPPCTEPPPPKPVVERDPRLSLLHGPKTPRGKQGQLLLMPGKISAPVGTEVVLLAGLCANDGFFMTDQPIQWTISPDSVGHFVSGNSSPTAWFHHRVEKIERDYALTRSVGRQLNLTRGTPQLTDDVTVRRGQSWISLTSPTPGTTYVTVVAPRAENWDQRRKTATIFWVDARWQFPGPVSARAGEAVPLVTRVTRQDGSPIAGWKVRYQLPPGNAVFAESGGATAEVTTDTQGEARVTVRQTTPAPETAAVSIEVLRPEPDGRTITMGRGGTTVHWSAPGLNARATGPTTTSVGATATYRFELFNPGDITTRQVTLTTTLPEGIEFVSSRPEAQIFGQQLQWNVGDLTARSTWFVDVVVRPKRAGDFRLTAVASSADISRVEASVDTRVIAEGLKVQFINPPRTARVGDQVLYDIEVSNTGAQPISGIVVTSQFDAGLRQVEGLTSPVRQELGTLQPGEAKGLSIAFQVEKAGQLRHRVDVTASDGQSAAVESVLEAAPASAPPSREPSQPTPPPAAAVPSVDIQLVGDTQKKVGESASYRLTVSNPSRAPLTNVVVALTFPPALRPDRASGGHRTEADRLIWTLDTLPAGETKRYSMECTCLAPAAQAIVQAIVTADGNIRKEDSVATVILGEGPAGPPPAAGPGTLELKVHDVRDPVRIGQRTTYVIQLANQRTTSDREIKLKFKVSKNLTIEGIDSPLKVTAQSDDGREVELEPIKELRPQEKMREIRVEVTAKGPEREAEFQVEATSELNPRPVKASETTTLLMP